MKLLNQHSNQGSIMYVKWVWKGLRLLGYYGKPYPCSTFELHNSSRKSTYNLGLVFRNYFLNIKHFDFCSFIIWH